MKTILQTLTLCIALLASSSWAADFVNPLTYDDSQKSLLVAYAREMAIKNYGKKNERMVKFITDKMVCACVWLSHATDRELLAKVVENWRDMDGDYMMMKFEYRQTIRKSLEKSDTVAD